jgi:hypothetical protein
MAGSGEAHAAQASSGVVPKTPVWWSMLAFLAEHP